MRTRYFAAAAFALLSGSAIAADPKPVQEEALTTAARIEFFSEAEDKMRAGVGILTRFKTAGAKPAPEMCQQRFWVFEDTVTKNLAEVQKDARTQGDPAVAQHAGKVEKFRAAVAEGCGPRPPQS